MSVELQPEISNVGLHSSQDGKLVEVNDYCTALLVMVNGHIAVVCLSKSCGHM